MERVYKKQGRRRKETKSRETAPDKLRVAAYCRISTNMELQETSYETQVAAYRNMINANPDWVLVDIFADHGITGTQAKKRTEFMRMIQCCREGKIDRILTKSISRFARNTLDCIKYVRELSGLGVTIHFEKEDIDTGSDYSEMLLTVMAAFAQEESRSLSENYKWGIRKRYQEGISQWNNIYGYRKVGDKKYVIDEEEAKVVREIFSLYENGTTVQKIAAVLNSKGIKSPSGGDRWPISELHVMLANEKYVGDLVLQKKYVEDCITQREVTNDGSKVPMYFVKDDHDPIITREQFARVSKIRKMRGVKNKSVTYPFGNEYLKCPFCGEPLNKYHIKPVMSDSFWFCDGCHQFAIRDKDIKSTVLRALQKREEFKNAESVEYIMLERSVDHIEIGKHKRVYDKCVKVFYKDGSSTKVMTNITRKSLFPSRLAAKALEKLQLENSSVQAEVCNENGGQP